MTELSKDQIAKTVAERIHEPMREFCEAIERCDPNLNAERRAFEFALCWAVADAVFEATHNGVTESLKGVIAPERTSVGEELRDTGGFPYGTTITEPPEGS